MPDAPQRSVRPVSRFARDQDEVQRGHAVTPQTHTLPPSLRWCSKLGNDARQASLGCPNSCVYHSPKGQLPTHRAWQFLEEHTGNGRVNEAAEKWLEGARGEGEEEMVAGPHMLAVILHHEQLHQPQGEGPGLAAGWPEGTGTRGPRRAWTQNEQTPAFMLSSSMIGPRRDRRGHGRAHRRSAGRETFDRICITLAWDNVQYEIISSPNVLHFPTMELGVSSSPTTVFYNHEIHTHWLVETSSARRLDRSDAMQSTLRLVPCISWVIFNHVLSVKNQNIGVFDLV
ncbi:hypothetical protein DFH27DRAFT_525447 [Peziza echinospora]|nr:hypothetical protein DFH27DRAFT_530037 [Peziza echinospora]KAI5800199.1 hypothetical protein DFH27DRAFT_525447 [Peziza echinospora]